MSKKDKIFNLQKTKPTKSDEHLLHIGKQVNKVFDEKYKFVPKNPIRRIIHKLIWVIALIVIPIVNFIIYGIKIRGKKYLRQAKKYKNGVVSVANHCLVMDSTMCAMVHFPRRTWLPTVEQTLKIPRVRHIIRALYVIPIPSNPKGLTKFSKTCDQLLQENNIIHFFPEGALWPGYDKLREFKPGAFRFAVYNGSPILPFCIYFRKRKGLQKLLGINHLVTLQILPPMFANKVFKPKAAIEDLMNRCYEAMKPIVESYEIPNSKYRKPDFVDPSIIMMEELNKAKTNKH